MAYFLEIINLIYNINTKVFCQRLSSPKIKFKTKKKVLHDFINAKRLFNDANLSDLGELGEQVSA